MSWDVAIAMVIAVVITWLWTDLRVWQRIAVWKTRRWDQSVEVWRQELRDAIAAGDLIRENIADLELTRALVKYHRWRKRTRG